MQAQTYPILSKILNFDLSKNSKENNKFNDLYVSNLNLLTPFIMIVTVPVIILIIKLINPNLFKRRYKLVEAVTEFGVWGELRRGPVWFI